MSVWRHWWQGRAVRAEHDAGLMEDLLRRILDSYGPSIAEWFEGKRALKEWNRTRPLRSGDGGAGYWSERAQTSEQLADMFARVLQAVGEHHNLSYAMWSESDTVLTEYVAHRELRYGMLPVGPTLEGNLKSGGVQ